MAESKDRRNPGWYVGVGAFWLIAIWLVAVGLSSIIPQIFGPASARVKAAPEDCTGHLLALEDELLERVSFGLSHPGGDREELDRWLRDWDRRLKPLGRACSQSDAEAASELSRLRHALRDTIRKLDREQGGRMHHIHTLLGRSDEQPGT